MTHILTVFTTFFSLLGRLPGFILKETQSDIAILISTHEKLKFQVFLKVTEDKIHNLTLYAPCIILQCVYK